MPSCPKRNTGFFCLLCGKENLPAEKTTRNHCQFCLFSQHVDSTLPGDRSAQCGGMMRPISTEWGHRKADFLLTHRCEQCGKEQRNRSAPDDNTQALFEVAREKVKNDLSSFSRRNNP